MSKKPFRFDREAALKRMQSPEFRKQHDRALKRWRKRMQPLIDAVRDSQRITADDLKIIVR